MKLTPGANFINVLRAAFTHADSRSAKKTDNLTVFFALVITMIFITEFDCIVEKAAHKILMKLTTDRIADQYVDTGGGVNPDSSDFQPFIPSKQIVEVTSNRTATIGDDVLLNNFSSDYDVSQETGVDHFIDYCF